MKQHKPQDLIDKTTDTLTKVVKQVPKANLTPSQYIKRCNAELKYYNVSIGDIDTFLNLYYYDKKDTTK